MGRGIDDLGNSFFTIKDVEFFLADSELCWELAHGRLRSECASSSVWSMMLDLLVIKLATICFLAEEMNRVLSKTQCFVEISRESNKNGNSSCSIY